ncbi:MAG: hypothetical protein OXC37_04640 [Bdellovibrionaceae bacterium]|nr:hypothetical protein [Pseudobdellovibrionaceae bacterium]
MFSARYLREVLGIKSYICPDSIQSLRRLEGGIPCHFLVIVFSPLSLSQKTLLKKIMSSIEIFKYSLIEVKEEKILDELFERSDDFAQFICFFGAKDFVQTGHLIQQEGQFFSALSKDKSSSFFQTPYSLAELEENSVSVREKKQDLWSQLKLWKSASKF